MQNLALKILITLLLLGIGNIAQSQPSKKAMERISTFKKIKLLEILDLNEDKSNEFIIALTKFDRNEGKLRKEKKELGKKLTSAIKDEHESRVKELLIEVEQHYMAMAENMKARMEKMKSILTPIQLAKFIVFNERFRHELGKRLLKGRNGHNKSRGRPDFDFD
jgi:Spy/CpxP family protein refolding chaperone